MKKVNSKYTNNYIDWTKYHCPDCNTELEYDEEYMHDKYGEEWELLPEMYHVYWCNECEMSVNGVGEKESMNEHIELALKTWYSEHHEHHFNLEPNLLGLAGEAGEMVDVLKKDRFKNGHEVSRATWLDELGDFWYYLRIVSYQVTTLGYCEYPLVSKHKWDKHIVNKASLLHIHSNINWLCAKTLARFELVPEWEIFQDGIALNSLYQFLLLRLEQLDCTIDELTKINWQKVQPGSERGEEWREARNENS
jgi:NTP pyrophosphatase (non-canonical NTP hydrolase)